jgi:L-serine dehydratase
MKTSLFEIFKIGIGPSSSHTVGPMRAAREFALSLERSGSLQNVVRVAVDLYGSLALTGRGHGTDRAVVLGLQGELPEQVDPATIEEIMDAARETRLLRLLSNHEIVFDENSDLIFNTAELLPGHSNGMRFTAFNHAGDRISAVVYYSIGGGFIMREGDKSLKGDRAEVPYPFRSATELLALGERHGMAIWEIALANEQTWRSRNEILSYVERIWQAMEASVVRGLVTEGVLPGGLKVRRRAPRLYRKLTASPTTDPLVAMDWVNAFAMAVNEENAAGGRVVTAPTNGAAGIIPAVGRYYLRFSPNASRDRLVRYLMTASAIGILYKENASISGAEVGCQGEVGVACSMAAGGLVAALGGTNRQIEYAAEIGMEHNLGMTCDPIGGLVQIPCIERNAMGAVKAINACRIAMRENGEHKVSLDDVIKTMYETGKDMQARYKETSLGGLATLNIIEC